LISKSDHLAVEPVGTYVSKWGEGPRFWGNALFYVDIEGHSVIRLCPDSQKEDVWDIGERIGAVTPTHDRGLLCAGDSGIFSFRLQSGEKKVLADPESAKRPDNRFNDGMCDPSGRFWAGTISTTKQVGDASLYMFDLEGQLHKKILHVTNSNGICWSEDASSMYYIDTPTKKVMAYPFENETGNLGTPKVVIDTQLADVEGSPDGMTIDNDGNLWIAMCHGGAVIQVETQTGKVVKKISFPCTETTACTFGGAQYDRLFVTTGLHKTLSEPDAGKVFVVDGLSTHGLPVVPYKGSI